MSTDVSPVGIVHFASFKHFLSLYLSRFCFYIDMILKIVSPRLSFQKFDDWIMLKHSFGKCEVVLGCISTLWTPSSSTFSMSSMQAWRSMPKSMKVHSMPSRWYSSCSSTNIWWLKNCCSFSFVKLMQSCSKPLNCGTGGGAQYVRQHRQPHSHQKIRISSVPYKLSVAPEFITRA